jgi:hypothetical protein
MEATPVLFSFEGMADLQSRLDTAFGNLKGQEQSDVPEWRPITTHVFRPGIESGEDSSGGEEAEREERRRREVMPGMPLEFKEEDVPDASGQLPSRSFCRQMDVEDEFDDVDALAMQFEDVYDRPNRETQVLKSNYDAHILKMTNGGGVEEIDQSISSDGDDKMQTHMEPIPSTSAITSNYCGHMNSKFVGPSAHHPSLKSAIRLKPVSPVKKKKKVSFCESVKLPPNSPWVPPHRRPGFMPIFDKESLRGEGMEVIPPRGGIKHGFARYDLEESLIVGGGVQQLSPREQRNAQPASSAHHTDEVRWQGEVGRSSIRFVRQPKRKGGTLEEAKQGQLTLRPSLLAFMDGQNDE